MFYAKDRHYSWLMSDQCPGDRRIAKARRHHVIWRCSDDTTRVKMRATWTPFKLLSRKTGHAPETPDLNVIVRAKRTVADEETVGKRLLAMNRHSQYNATLNRCFLQPSPLVIKVILMLKNQSVPRCICTLQIGKMSSLSRCWVWCEKRWI